MALASFLRDTLYAGHTAVAPAWNRLVRLYHHHHAQRLVFADVDLSVLQGRRGLRGHHGDWPCIRYYNSVTGIEGEDYVPQHKRRTDGTELRLCEELGPRHYYLIEFVTQVVGFPLCRVDGDRKDCDEISLRFLKTVEEEHEGRDVMETWTTQLEYFQSQLQANPGNWEHFRRMDLLQQLIAQKEKQLEEEEEL